MSTFFIIIVILAICYCLFVSLGVAHNIDKLTIWRRISVLSQCIQELIRRWDSKREFFYDDIAHVL